MIVNGYDVPQVVIDACITRMKKAPFRAYQIAEVAHEVASVMDARDIGGHVAASIADRIIQRLRRERKIKIKSYPLWTWAEAVRG